MNERRFAHLHCHSHYSLLDGASPIPKLVKRAKERGMNALAITDHGNLHGALQFYKACKDEGINPIVGYEAYIAPGSRFDKSNAGSSKEASFHLTLLAQNRVGFRNLVKLASYASLEGFYYKPRIDKELLEAHSEGIVCLSGCVSSEFSSALLRGHGGEKELKDAIGVAGWFRKLFGERYFVEIMNNGVEIQRIAMEGAIDIAEKLGLPLVATSDCHYIDKEDAHTQDVLLCINTGKFRTDTNRMKMDGTEFYLRSPEEMYAKFVGMEDAVARSQEIADSVDLDLELGKRYFPTYPLPKQATAEEYLRELCEQGLKERYAGDEEMLPGGELSEVVRARLDRELSVVAKLGFSNYFLIVWDFVREAREQGIPATARGSGVGAIVCYSLYLSHVCPIRYDLLFERFLDENRKEAPDIDIDFCKDLRGNIIRYVKEKYGEANVAQIGTFGTLAARAAIKDVGRALSIPLARVNEITGMVPETLGISLDRALEVSEDLKKAYDGDRDVREMLDFARKIEGLARNVGTHAAAVVIADKPLTEYVPLSRVSGKDDIITQWSMNDVEAAGLLKMDFLGLRNLTILRKVVDLVEKTTGQRIDPLKFPLDDEPTFALLQRGETKGVFQLESGGIRDLLQKMKPDHFRDIIATNALYRPGPLEGGMVDEYVAVKRGRKEAQYKHPVLKEILEETNGVMVYQEQVMRILNRLGGIPLAASYTCIKAISKKKQETIEKNYEQFMKGAVAEGLKKNEAQEFWDMIVKFAGYGFNKSHSTAYALIAYQTAYLKAHWPIEFMAALLSSDIQGRNFKRKDALVEHLEDCQRMSIEVVPPDVNRSHVEFAVEEGKILFALSAVKGCGGSAAEAIVREREKEGRFKDLFEFCQRIEASECNRAALETLIRAGAFDSMGARRSQLDAALDKALQAGASALADKRSGQKNLFGDDEEDTTTGGQSLPDTPDWPEKEKLAHEKEVLGFYLSSHPLHEYKRKLAQYVTHTTGKLDDVPDRQEILMGGMIGAIKLAHTKNPKPDQPSKYANFDLEDWDGAVRCVQWPRDYAKYGELIVPEAVVIVRGGLDRRGGDEPNLMVSEILTLEQAEAKFTSGVRILVDENVHPPEIFGRLREILRAYPGKRDVQIVIQLTDGPRVVVRSGGIAIDLAPELRERVNDLLGPNRFSLIAAAPTVSKAPPQRFGKGSGYQGKKQATA